MTALGVAVVLVLVVAGRGVGDGGSGAVRGAGAGDVELRERVGVLLVARLRFQNDAVLVGLTVDGGNLPLAEGVVERVGDALHGDAEPSGLFAIDVDLHARAAFLRFGGDFAQRRITAQTARQLVGPFDHFGAVGGHQRVLILRAAHAGGNLDVLCRLEIHGHAGDTGDRVLQPRDDLIDSRAAVVSRLQGDGEPPGIGRGIDRADADDRYDTGHVRVGPDGILHQALDGAAFQ